VTAGASADGLSSLSRVLGGPRTRHPFSRGQPGGAGQAGVERADEGGEAVRLRQHDQAGVWGEQTDWKNVQWFAFLQYTGRWTCISHLPVMIFRQSTLCVTGNGAKVLLDYAMPEQSYGKSIPAADCERYSLMVPALLSPNQRPGRINTDQACMTVCMMCSITVCTMCCVATTGLP
jgi:hypothetical protein